MKYLLSRIASFSASEIQERVIAVTFRSLSRYYIMETKYLFVQSLYERGLLNWSGVDRLTLTAEP